MATRAPDVAGVGGNQDSQLASFVTAALDQTKQSIDRFLQLELTETDLENAGFEVMVRKINGRAIYTHFMVPNTYYIFARNNGHLDYREKVNGKDAEKYQELYKSTTS